MTSMVRFSPSLLFTFIGRMITKVFCISLTLITFLFDKNSFMRTKALILAKKVKASLEQSQACSPPEHKNIRKCLC